MLDSYIPREISSFLNYFYPGDEVLFNGKVCFVLEVYPSFIELACINGESYFLEMRYLNYNSLSKGGIEYVNKEVKR